MISLFRKEIEGEFEQENFKRLQDNINASPFEKGQFKFFEISVNGAVTNYKHKHNLSFVPKDIITLHVSPAVTLTWNYANFDRTNLDFTTSGATTIRAFVGRYEEN
jgi:hypothetical protein